MTVRYSVEIRDIESTPSIRFLVSLSIQYGTASAKHVVGLMDTLNYSNLAIKSSYISNQIILK